VEAYLDIKNKAFIRYLDFPGAEPAVVYLAGLGLASTAIYPRVVVEPSLSNRRSILIDMFGCGYSDKPDHYSYTLEQHASTLSGLLDTLGAKKYIVVGHSLGGAVAIELAVQRSDLIGQIILAEANLEAGGGPGSKAITNLTEREFVENGYQETIERSRKKALNGDYIASISMGMWQVASPMAIYRSAVSVVKGTQPVMWDQLIRMSIPRTYLFGSRSLEAYEEDREMYTRLEAHGIRVDVVQDAGHGMMADNPKGFADAISKAISLAKRHMNTTT
jgi:pimeloyl-ACP methyl ester carboxylesterase